MTNYQQPGEILEFSNSGSAISSGDFVVIGNRVGCAIVDIASTGTGSVQMTGVFTASKDNDEAFSQGDELFYDTSDGTFTKTATGNKWAGYAFEAAAESATSCVVKLEARPKQSAIVAYTAGTNLTAVPGTFADEAAVQTYLVTLLAEIETRLDAQDTFIAALLAALKASGQMSNS